MCHRRVQIHHIPSIIHSASHIFETKSIILSSNLVTNYIVITLVLVINLQKPNNNLTLTLASNPNNLVNNSSDLDSIDNANLFTNESSVKKDN